MKQKGFTLIELLVVVAIIGILAAIGVVSFTGFQKAAKRNATIANFENFKKFYKTELNRCSVGEGPIKLKNASGDTIEWKCSGLEKRLGEFTSAMDSHLEATGWKNPYTGWPVIGDKLGDLNSDEDQGYIYIRSKYLDSDDKEVPLEDKAINSAPYVIP